MKNSRYKSIIIFFLTFIFYLSFTNSLIITDPVESNYALTAKEMMSSGNWVSPQIYGQYWFDKPIFYYWVMAASFYLFGISELSARIGSAFFSALGVALIYWFTARLSGNKKGMVAAGILATSLQYIVLAKLILTDTALFFFANAALVFFYLGYIRHKNTGKWYILVYPCMALAVLTKGPVGMLLPSFIIFVFLLMRKNLQEMRKMHLFWGFIVFAAISLPWYGIMYAKHGGYFLESFFGIHNYLRATVSEHPRDNVFYYYPFLLILAMLPWSGLGLLSVYYGAVAAWRNKCTLSCFCFVWVVAYVLFYSLMATKYPTYVFPVLFPLAVLISRQVSFSAFSRKKFLIWVVLPFALMFIAFAFALPLFLQGTLLYLSEVVFILFLFSVCYQLRNYEIKRVVAIVAGCVVLNFLVLSVTAFPYITEGKSGKMMAAQIQPYREENIGIYRHYSTSAVFYSGNILIKIVDEREKEQYNPHAKTWFRKYTMPVKTLQEFAQISGMKKNILIVEKSKWTQFMHEAHSSYSFNIVEECPDFYIVEIS